MQTKLFSYLIFCLLIISLGCSQETKKQEKKTPEKKVQTQVQQTESKVPGFDGASAYRFIEQQLVFGPRVPNTAGHQACGDYLVETLKKYGASVEQQKFEMKAYDGTPLQLRNIIASFNPEKKKRILLAAHWDTRHVADKDVRNRERPIPGANDGASGVAILLEIARLISINDKPEVGIDLILFDGEDYGAPNDYQGMTMGITYCLGSQYWSENKHQPNYSAYYGILLDMVGAEGAQFYQEGYSRQYAPKVVKKVWDAAHQIGYGHFFPYKNSSPITDDHQFVNENANIPMVDIIAYDPSNPGAFFPDYHHTHKDDLAIIDSNTLKAVGQTVLHVIYTEK